MARAAHSMALESPRVRSEVTEISEFPRLSQRYGVRGVPTTVINDRYVVVGAMDETKLLEQVLKAAQPEKGALAPSTEQGGETTPAESPQPPPGPSRPPGGGIVLP